MRLYLARHGEALASSEDPAQQLSERGRGEVQRVAAFLAAADLRVGRVVHSGKRRAEQTAELLARALGGPAPEAIAGLQPLDPPAPLAETVLAGPADTLIVGHLPLLAGLVSHLLVGSDAVTTAGFSPGTILCLERDEERVWSISWMIRPELLPRRTSEHGRGGALEKRDSRAEV